MSHKAGRLAFTVFHVTLAVVIFIESSLTVIHSFHSTTQSHLGSILPWFAGVEALAAVMLLIPQTVKIAGCALLTIFLVALVVHGPAEQTPLFVYAAGVVLIMTLSSTYKQFTISNTELLPRKEEDQ